MLFLVLCGATVLLGGTVWLLHTSSHPLTALMADSTAWPAWLKQAQTYATPEVKPTPAPQTRKSQNYTENIILS